MEDDYTIYDSGHLGALTSVAAPYGEHLGEFPDFDSACAAIREHMDAEQFWPGVWYQDDHGGIDRVDVTP